MKIILVSFGSYGDINPFIWMAKTFKDSGHNPVIITNTYFREIIEQENIEFYGIGNEIEYIKLFDSIDVTSRKNKTIDMFKNLKKFINHICIDPIHETINIIKKIKTEDTLILNSMLAFGAGLAAKKYSLNQRTIALSPTVISSFKKEEPLFKSILSIIKYNINSKAFKVLYGKHIKKISHDLQIEIEKPNLPNWIFKNGTICLFPEWFMNFTLKNDRNISFAGFPNINSSVDIPIEFKNFLDLNPEPIVFTPGTPFRHNSIFFNEALKALISLSKPGVFLTKNINSVPKNLPPSIYVSEFLPLNKFLDKCSLIVHHGGIGTTSQGISSGIPQIIFYHQGLDQKYNGAVVEKLDIARIADYKSINADLIIQYAKELLDSNKKDNFVKLKSNKLNSSEKEMIKIISDIHNIILRNAALTN